MYNGSINGRELLRLTYLVSIIPFYKILQGNTRGSLCLMNKCKCCTFRLICLCYMGQISSEYTSVYRSQTFSSIACRSGARIRSHSKIFNIRFVHFPRVQQPCHTLDKLSALTLVAVEPKPEYKGLRVKLEQLNNCFSSPNRIQLINPEKDLILTQDRVRQCCTQYTLGSTET